MPPSTNLLSITVKRKKWCMNSNPNQPFDKNTALKTTEKLVSPKPFTIKEEMLSIENKYTGDTFHEEKKQEIITLKVQEDNQETKMTLNCGVGDLRNTSNVKDLQNHRPSNLKKSKVSTLNERKQSFGCNICKTFFPSKSDLVVHIESVHSGKELNENPRKTRVFHDKYKQKHMLAKEHFSPVHEEKKKKVMEIQDNHVKMPLDCGIGHIDYSEKQDYNLHFKEQHPEKFFCEFCNEIFLTVGSLMQHISKIHEEIKLKVKECNFKSDIDQSNSEKDPIDVPTNVEKTSRELNTFLSTKETRKRSRYGSRNNVCQICNESFATNCILKRHSASVHEIKKSSNESNEDFDVKIDPLDVSFNPNKRKLNASNLIDKDEKRLKTEHVCQICDEIFTSICKLRRHTTSDHKLDCKICFAKFLQIQELKRHIITVHEEKKELTCDRCESKFAKKSILTRHIKVVHESFHEGNRPHKCEKCDAEFNKESHLKDHIAALHEENRPHKCKMCSLAFSFSTDLINHVSVVHERKKPEPYIVNVGEKRGGCY